MVFMWPRVMETATRVTSRPRERRVASSRGRRYELTELRTAPLRLRRLLHHRETQGTWERRRGVPDRSGNGRVDFRPCLRRDPQSALRLPRQDAALSLLRA